MVEQEKVPGHPGLHFLLNIPSQEQVYKIVPQDYCLPSSLCVAPSIVTVNWFHWKMRQAARMVTLYIYP